MLNNKTYAWLVLLCLSLVEVKAQKEIIYDDLFGRPTFAEQSVRNINWMLDGQYYSAQEGNDIIKYDVANGQAVETILAGGQLEPNISFTGYTFSADEQKLLLLAERESIYRRSFKAEYYVYDLANGSLQKLSPNGKQSYATFSPDGSMVAFTRNNNLFFVRLADMQEFQVTKDGALNKIINGSTDWVYEEELYLTKAFFWSPDNQKIAFYTFDESQVKEYNMQRWTNDVYPVDYRYKYPKAGEQNALVSVSIYHLNNDKIVPVDLGNETDIYLPRTGWTLNADKLYIQRLNRLQNQLDLLHVEAETGKSEVVLTEKSDTYIDITYCDDLTYLADGKHFIRTSEQDAFKHVYLHKLNGELVRQITKGNWEVTTLVGIDESKKKPEIYFISTEESPLERYFYVINIEGERKEKLSEGQGVNSVNMSRDFSYYINYLSNAEKPRQVSLYQTKKNKLVKVLEDNAELQETVSEYALAKKEFFTFETVDGSPLNGYMLKPANFQESQQYPVLVFQYSGPGSQMVMNSFGGGHFYFHQMLVQKGYIVACIDNRGTGGRGADFKKITYAQMGKIESEDFLAFGRHLKTLPYVAPERIGIWGWSYGGYMSALTLFLGAEEKVYSMGMSIAPVTNWRFYDTIYTERYLKRPQDNPGGYDDYSPNTHAAKLEGKFLLVHGTGDDNVHFQNAVTLQDELIAAGRQFDSFYYPNRAHGIYRGGARRHLYEMMANYVYNNL